MSRRTKYFVFLIVAAAILSWTALIAAYETAWHDGQQSHMLLVLPVSMVLLYSERYKVLRNVGFCLPAGVIFVLLSAASLWIAWHPLSLGQNGSLSLRMFLFVACCIAGFLLCYGTAAFRVAAFPLLFLLFLVPIPDFVLERIIWLLQRGSTDASFLLLKAANVSVSREGFVLSLSGIDIEVARECSGIRSSLTLLVVTLVLGRLFLRSGWRKGLLWLLVLPVAIAMNGLRIFMLSLLGPNLDSSFFADELHRYSGIPSFAVALGVVILILWWLHKSENELLTKGAQPSPAQVRPEFMKHGT